MPSILTIRNDLDNVLQAKQSLMSVKTYNKYWRMVAENWDDKEELGKLYTKINKIKQSKVSKLKQELKALRDAGEINPNVKLNQSEEKLKDIYNNHYLSKFDNDEIIVKPTKKVKPVITEMKKFKNTISEWRFDNTQENNSSNQIINYAQPPIRQEFKKFKNISVVFSFVFTAKLPKNDEEDKEQFIEMPHTLHRFVILNESQIQETMNEVKTDIRNIFEQVAQQQRVSGLTDIKIKTMDVKISPYKPLRAGSYIPLDEFLTNKKCCINIQNEDDKCLMYCVLYHINQKSIKKDPQRVSKYKPYENQFDFSSIKFPASLHEVNKMETC